MLIKCVRKMTTYQLKAGLARLPFVLTEHISSAVYIYIWRYMCHNSTTCHAYIMWAELGHCHFLYMPAVLNVVTTGNGMSTKNVLKWNRALGFEFSIHPIFCLRHYNCSESKPILYQDTVYCKFLLYVYVEIDQFRGEQTSAI